MSNRIVTKKYVVTDPCYLIGKGDKSEEIWHNYCNLLDTDHDEADKILSEYLCTEIVTCETGFGDWVNHIRGQEFFADSGLVCVCELTDRIRELYKNAHSEDIDNSAGVAIIDLVNPTVNFNTSDPNWTIVEIDDNGYLITSDYPEYEADEEFEDENYSDMFLED